MQWSLASLVGTLFRRDNLVSEAFLSRLKSILIGVIDIIVLLRLFEVLIVILGQLRSLLSWVIAATAMMILAFDHVIKFLQILFDVMDLVCNIILLVVLFAAVLLDCLEP